MPTNSLTPAVVPALELANSNRVWETLPTLHDDMENHPNFIEGVSNKITMDDLTNKCVIPTWGNGSLIISHQQFIETVRMAAMAVFGQGNVTPAECRVSHPIIGRIPSAQHKKASELTDEEKTLTFQRLAFVSKIPAFTTTINGQKTTLSISGVRSLHEERLYGKECPLHFSIAISFKLLVCSNLLISHDGLLQRISCLTPSDIFDHAVRLFSQFSIERNLHQLEMLNQVMLSQEQFCQILGRLRLYNVLPTQEKKSLPQIILGDSIINAATREYITNPNFGVQASGDTISCWQLMNLLNEAAKASYPDLFLERNANCTELATGIANAIIGDDTKGYSWFLN